MRGLLCSALALLIFLPCCQCFAEPNNGVLVKERILELPQDQDKWYVSVVGSGQKYERLLNWFDTNEQLISLKKQVHFHAIAEGSQVFESRYATNIDGLPTVRVQVADGTVIYEVAGKYIPYTAGGLYGAIAGASQQAQGIFPIRPWKRGKPPWIPWRRERERRCPGPCPVPTPAPVPVPVPDVDLVDGGAPIFEEEAESSSAGLVVLLVIVSAVVGATTGVAVQWKRTYEEL